MKKALNVNRNSQSPEHGCSTKAHEHSLKNMEKMLDKLIFLILVFLLTF